MKKCWIVIGALILISFATSAFSQEQRILSLEDIEELLKSGVGQIRIAELISKHGIDFGFTEEVRARLKKLGASARVIEAVEKVAKKRPTSKDGVEAVLVPAGEFWMGSEDSDAGADEKPRRRVYLDAFNIDKYEVTNALYRRFMEATGRGAPSEWGNNNFNAPNQPVVGVSWHDAEAYCKWAGKRLPTEAEWEKAARGTDGRKYPWGDQWDSSRANSSESKTAAVGSYANGVSPYGVHDMAGNVWEWVGDWYDANYYQRAANRNPKGPDSGSSRVLRGGSWYYSPGALRTSYRNGNVPAYRGYFYGFRCAQ